MKNKKTKKLSNKNEIYWLNLSKEQLRRLIHRLAYRWNKELALRARLLLSLNRVKKKGPKTLQAVANEMAIPLVTLQNKFLLFQEIGFEDFINVDDN